MAVSSSSSRGIGFGGLLTILFIALKLTHFIDWSWWWVLSPMLIPLGLLVAMFAGIGALYAMIYLGDKLRGHKGRYSR